MQRILRKYFSSNDFNELLGNACKSILFGKLKNVYVVSAIVGWLLYAVLNYMSESIFTNDITSSFLWHRLYGLSISLCFFTCLCIIVEYVVKFYYGPSFMYCGDGYYFDWKKDRSIPLKLYVTALHAIDILIVLVCLINLASLVDLWGKFHGQIFPTYSSPVFQFLMAKSTPIRDALNGPFENLTILLLFHLISDPREQKRIMKSFLYGFLNKLMIIAGSVVAVVIIVSSFQTLFRNINLLILLDAFFSVLFVIELTLRLWEEGVSYFFKNEFGHTSRLDIWNILDFIVIVLSASSVFMLLDHSNDSLNLSSIIVLRFARILKLFRIVKEYQRDMERLVEGVKNAMTKSFPILIIFLIILVILGFLLSAVSQAMNGVGQEYFGNPQSSIFTLFQMFTYDGWHDIPQAIADDYKEKYESVQEFIGPGIKFAFCILVGAGGIVGIALLNSVFVDGMLGRDKDDAVKMSKLQEIYDKLEQLSTKIDELESRESKLR